MQIHPGTQSLCHSPCLQADIAGSIFGDESAPSVRASAGGGVSRKDYATVLSRYRSPSDGPRPGVGAVPLTTLSDRELDRKYGLVLTRSAAACTPLSPIQSSTQQWRS